MEDDQASPLLVEHVAPSIEKKIVNTAEPSTQESIHGTNSKVSPSKLRGNQLNIDTNASLASISARLAIAIPPAESEIARINREILLGVSKRYQLRNSKNSEMQIQVDSASNDDQTMVDRMDDNTLKVANHTAKSAMTAALHESIIAEEWVNLHLEAAGSYLLPATDLGSLIHKSNVASGLRSDDSFTEVELTAFRKSGNGGPLARAGIDRTSLYRLGMSKDLVDRLYRALYVYTNGFHNIINEIASQSPPLVEQHISSNVWLAFLLLLEQCGDGKYEMAMLKFKQATEEWRRLMQEEFSIEKARIESQLRIVEADLQKEVAHSAEKSSLLAKLTSEVANSNTMVADQQRQMTILTEQVRLLKLEILVHEDNEQKLNEQLDDTRKDYELAHSERLNAMTEHYALEEEIRRLQSELERIEADKANFAKRMHETLFMNQALRATNETLKQNAVVMAMEKQKLGNEKQSLQDQLNLHQQDIQILKIEKAQVEKEIEDITRKHDHVESRLQNLKEQLDVEVEANAKQAQEVALLTAQIDEEKVKTGILEAKCNLLTAEKQNTGMRAQDKLRIERLLNQKLDLENQVEALKLDRTKDHEQLRNLRASLEAVETEMQHSKRVFSASQQAFLHSERICEQLRHQLHDIGKNYDKSTKNLASLKERFKLFEESSKDQITKLEVELKVTSAQLREVSYANRDNTALMAELEKSVEIAGRETKNLKSRLETSEEQLISLRKEKEDWQRDKKQQELQHSTSKNAIQDFIRTLQHILALVKRDEFPLDEALRELLRIVEETFGNELDVEKVLEAEDELQEFEEELDDEDQDGEVERKRRRRGATFAPLVDDTHSTGDTDNDDNDRLAENTVHDSDRPRTQTTRMSQFRKSKLDKLVKKLQKETALKAELIQSLEGVICDQSDQIANLTTANEQQQRWLKLNENQKGMLRDDVEGRCLQVIRLSAEKRYTEISLDEARSDAVAQAKKVYQSELMLSNIRRQFDMQCASYEDLLSRIWRAYEQYLLMLSLRRDKEIQATVMVVNESTQTLVPQRNPATERQRITSKYMPVENPHTANCETIIKQINDAARVLLPGVTTDIDMQVALEASIDQSRRGIVQPSKPTARSTSHHRSYRGNVNAHGGKRYERTCGIHNADVLSTLPVLNFGATSPHIIRHVNEFGTRQDVLISPRYPSVVSFDSFGSKLLSTTGSHIPTSANVLVGHKPRKPLAPTRQVRPYQFDDVRLDDQYDERCDSPKQRPEKPAPRESRKKVQTRLRHHRPLNSGPDILSSPSTESRLRPHRGFLNAGMEVLRNSVARHVGDEADEFNNSNDDWSDASNPEGSDSENEHYDNEKHGHYQWSTLSLHSPGRLEVAVREYQKEQQEYDDEDANDATQRNRFAGTKDDEMRQTLPVHDDNDGDDTGDVDSELAGEMNHSSFVPGILYPILPK